MDNPGPAIFDADPNDEYRLTFSVPDVLCRKGRRALMTMRCFEEDKLRGAIVWLGEHQHLWPEWRLVAEAHGGNALSARIVAITTKEALERFGSTEYMLELCMGATTRRGAGKTDVELSMTLATRSVPIITHAFKNARSREAFMDYLMSRSGRMGSVELRNSRSSRDATRSPASSTTSPASGSPPVAAACTEGTGRTPRRPGRLRSERPSRPTA